MVSTRRAENSTSNRYETGQKVEIIRDGSLDIGILLGPSEDYQGRDSPSGSSYSTHWIVSVDGQSKEVEVSERYLGRVLNSASSGKRKPVTRKAKAVAKPSATARPSAVIPNDHKVKALSKPVTAKAATKKQGTDNNASTDISASSTSNNKPKASGTKRQRGETSDLFVGDVGDIEKTKNKKAKVPPPKCEAGESVRVIPMLTGKLYLYRGKNPRAEFKYFV